MPTNKTKHILVAPLDWGLGHTARCVPVISCLQRLGHRVTVAGNRSQRSFIEETFGAIDFIHLEGYNITYSRWNKWAQADLVSQVPGILKTIRKEHEWLAEQVLKLNIDGVISDNRYGLYHQQIPSVIMTHQLLVQSGAGLLADEVIQKVHYKYLRRFRNTWIVDAPGEPDLGGLLSHPRTLPPRSEYLGLISRFSDVGRLPQSITDTDNGPVLILLSGPEPLRTEFSKILWQQAVAYNGNIIFVEGSDAVQAPAFIPPHIIYHKRLTHNQLDHLIRSAGVVVCRSGYSTLMDLASLQKKAVIVPTPGQTEQQYLAQYLHQKGAFYATEQHKFNLEKTLHNSNQFAFKPLQLQSSFELHKKVITGWTESL